MIVVVFITANDYFLPVVITLPPNVALLLLPVVVALLFDVVVAFLLVVVYEATLRRSNAAAR